MVGFGSEATASPAPPAVIARALHTREFPNLIPRAGVVTSTDPTSTVLYVGQQPTDGTVSLAIIGSPPDQSLKVTFSSVSGFTYKECQVWFGTGVPPTTAPGQFPYKCGDQYCAIAADGKSATCVFPLTLFPTTDLCDNTLWSIATHVALHGDNEVDPTKTETGWGFGPCINDPCNPWAMYWTFRFVCTTEPPPPPPPPSTCNGTGFGYVPGKSKTFSELSLGQRWGWVVSSPISAFPIEGPIYVGAGNDDISNAILVGKITIAMQGSKCVITYTFNPPYGTTSTHVYIGKVNPTKIAPGQLGFSHDHQSPVMSDVYEFSPTDKDSNGVIMSYLGTPSTTMYFVCHADVVWAC